MSASDAAPEARSGLRILMVHNRYTRRGGEDESTELEIEMLRDMGHSVEFYEESNDRIEDIGRARSAARATWSHETYRAIREVLGRQHFDLVHVQNFFPLVSPSVHWAAGSCHVPVVQTLRNYRLACANGLFFRDGAPCEDCLGKALPWPAVYHRCYRGVSGSTAVALFQVSHRLLHTWSKKVQAFICLTEFARERMVELGLPPSRLHVKGNFLWPDPGPSDGGGAFLFVGRLSPEKGIKTLLAAWRRVAATTRLDVIGDGPLAPLVRGATEEMPNITWLGQLSRSAVVDRMARARAVIVPSEWYETFGRVGVEAMACATPVLASRLGALQELVDPGVNGLLFDPGDDEALAACVAQFESTDNAVLRDGARRIFEEKYSRSQNYERLMSIYASAIRGA